MARWAVTFDPVWVHPQQPEVIYDTGPGSFVYVGRNIKLTKYGFTRPHLYKVDDQGLLTKWLAGGISRQPWIDCWETSERPDERPMEKEGYFLTQTQNQREVCRGFYLTYRKRSYYENQVIQVLMGTSRLFLSLRRHQNKSEWDGATYPLLDQTYVHDKGSILQSIDWERSASTVNVVDSFLRLRMLAQRYALLRKQEAAARQPRPTIKRSFPHFTDETLFHKQWREQLPGPIVPMFNEEQSKDDLPDNYVLAGQSPDGLRDYRVYSADPNVNLSRNLMDRLWVQATSTTTIRGKRTRKNFTLKEGPDATRRPPITLKAGPDAVRRPPEFVHLFPQDERRPKQGDHKAAELLKRIQMELKEENRDRTSKERIPPSARKRSRSRVRVVRYNERTVLLPNKEHRSWEVDTEAVVGAQPKSAPTRPRQPPPPPPPPQQVGLFFNHATGLHRGVGEPSPREDMGTPVNETKCTAVGTLSTRDETRRTAKSTICTI